MSAIRLARGATGRDRIVKFAGNYHGHVDSLLVAAGSAAATLAVPNSPGVTQGTTQDTLILPYNDVDSLVRAFQQQGDRIAAGRGEDPGFIMVEAPIDIQLAGGRLQPGDALQLLIEVYHVAPQWIQIHRPVGGAVEHLQLDDAAERMR